MEHWLAVAHFYSKLLVTGFELESCVFYRYFNCHMQQSEKGRKQIIYMAQKFVFTQNSPNNKQLFALNTSHCNIVMLAFAAVKWLFGWRRTVYRGL